MSRRTIVLALAFACTGGLLSATGFAQPADQTGSEALRLRIEQLQATLAGDVCANPDAARAVLMQTVPGSASTPASAMDGSLSTQTASLPPPEAPAESRASQPATGGQARHLTRRELVAHLQQTVVLVVAGSDTGSGFFVTPDTVVTNNHVVENAGREDILLVGPALGGIQKARLIARTGDGGQNSRDYAILRVEGAKSKAVLPLASDVTALDSVVAAGFPGLLLDNDLNFRAMLRGDMNAMPDLALSQGAIMAVQNQGRGLTTLAHTAPISGGNSGGPLVDACGRVVGINTFINVAVEQASSAGFALASSDLITYLRDKGVSPTLSADRCEE